MYYYTITDHPTSSHLSGHSFQDNVRYPVGIQPRKKKEKKKSNNLKEKIKEKKKRP